MLPISNIGDHLVSKSLDTIRERGDLLEREYSELIAKHIPKYAEFWYYFVGNDGHNRSLFMPGLDNKGVRTRQHLWQLLYSIFEALILLQRLEEKFPERIPDGDTDILLAWLTDRYTWYSLVGRVRDMMKDSSEVVGVLLPPSINVFWVERCEVIHGATMPLNWQANQITTVIPDGVHWDWSKNQRRLWSEVPDTAWVELKQKMKADFVDLAVIVDSHFGRLHGKVKENLGFSYVDWGVQGQTPENSKLPTTQPSSSMTSPVMIGTEPIPRR